MLVFAFLKIHIKKAAPWLRTLLFCNEDGLLNQEIKTIAYSTSILG